MVGTGLGEILYLSGRSHSSSTDECQLMLDKFQSNAAMHVSLKTILNEIFMHK